MTDHGDRVTNKEVILILLFIILVWVIGAIVFLALNDGIEEPVFPFYNEHMDH